MSKIDYIGADNGGLALYAGNVTIRATTVEAVAEAMKNHGLAEIVMGSSSMDFASEEGFETDDGALNMWNEAIGIYNWEVNGVAS